MKPAPPRTRERAQAGWTEPRRMSSVRPGNAPYRVWSAVLQCYRPADTHEIRKTQCTGSPCGQRTLRSLSRLPSGGEQVSDAGQEARRVGDEHPVALLLGNSALAQHGQPPYRLPSVRSRCSTGVSDAYGAEVDSLRQQYVDLLMGHGSVGGMGHDPEAGSVGRSRTGSLTRVEGSNWCCPTTTISAHRSGAAALNVATDSSSQGLAVSTTTGVRAVT
ncbi:MAG: hypothetical protein JWR57_456 [Mycetocola sp.]|nr:hypothetical protein [Mycetocola sp.]